MPSKSRRIWPALVCGLLSLLAVGALAAPVALAGTPATVTVRVLGQAPSYEALTPPTQVTTTTTSVTKNGGSCSGTSVGGALELATKGDWEGTWSSKYSDYEVISIDGRAYPFGEGLPYWSFWLNNKYEEEGVCAVELEAGDQVLFFPECFSETECPSPTHVLGIDTPATAEVDEPTVVTVLTYNAKGEPAPAANVNVGGWGSSAVTNSEGKATVVFPGDETYTLRATGAAGEQPLAVPGEVLVCAHTGDDGTCGTSSPSGSSTPVTNIASGGGAGASAPYTGAYAVVADLAGIKEGHVYGRGKGPRVLAGTVTAHASVTSISLRLRRTYKGRCWSYNGSRERLQHVHCGQGSFFQIASGGDSFSYLLPSRLPPGRYVLDIAASDSAGNQAPLDRGSSRVVFYVK